MDVKTIWTHENFDEMGWHDCKIYSLSFPSDDLCLSFDLDYIFKWVEDNNSQFLFWVSPCTLIFFNVLFLKINLDFGNVIGLEIELIERENIGTTPDNITPNWRYCIETNQGKIEFESTGFKQVVKKQPILTKSQVLDR